MALSSRNVAAMDEQTVDNEPSDFKLLESIAVGDQQSIAALYDRHQQVAFRVALRIVHDRGRAEDVLQEAFLSVWRKAATYSASRGSVRGWLMGIVRNRAIDMIRSQRTPYAGDESLLNFVRDPGPSTAELVDSRLEADVVRSALSLLPEGQRHAITASYFGGRTHAEIAEESGIPLGTVHGRVRLGMRRLQAHLAAAELRGLSTESGGSAGFGAIIGSTPPSPQNGTV